MLFFDSRFRDYSLYPTPDRFLITLIRPITNVAKITLANVMVRDIPGGMHWLFGVSIDKYGQGITRPEGATEYPQALLGMFDRTESPHSQYWRLYRDIEDDGLCCAKFPGRIPRLSEFEIGIMCADEVGGVNGQLIPAPIYDSSDPDPDMSLARKNWYGTLVIEHYDTVFCDEIDNNFRSEGERAQWTPFDTTRALS